MDDQNNPPHNPNDIVYNIMPQEGKGFSMANLPQPSNNSGSPPPPPLPQSSGGSSRKWLYMLVGLVVVLALGGLAYYMLGMKKEEAQQTVSKLPKTFLTQYFRSDNCSDPATCGDDADPDKDGLGNYDEFKEGTNPLNPDHDGDGLADGDELHIYKTDPELKYTDRREIVATNNWTDGYQIKSEFDPLTPGLKFTQVRKSQITEAIKQFQQHEPTITTLKGTATPSPTPSSLIPANWKTYTNSKLAFEVKYPSNYSDSPYIMSAYPSAQYTELTNLAPCKDYSCLNIRIFENHVINIADESMSQVKVGQNTFYFEEICGVGLDYSRTYSINNKGKFISIGFDKYNTNNAECSSKPDDGVKQLETQVLSSYKLTK